jgi:3-oxoacyl-[acyl-carrier-protein] synthase II
MRVFITGLGHLSALGRGVETLNEGLRGERIPELQKKIVSTRHGDRDVSFYKSPEVSLPQSIPDSIKRRMARIAKMCFASAHEAVHDAFGIEHSRFEIAPEKVGIVVGTAFGCIDLANAYQKRVILEGPSGASPSLFSGSVQNAIAAQLSISFNVQGPASTVTTMDHTAIASFRLAFDWLRSGVSDHVIVTIGDEHSDFHTYAMADLGVSAPFDSAGSRSTAIAGEGMMSFVLSREDAAPETSRYCEVTDVQLNASALPPVDRFFGSCEKENDDLSRHHIVHHAHLFGSMVTSAAFEIGIAALRVRADHRSTACVQSTHNGASQFVSLR